MPTHVRSYSKINLGLAIGPVRADGFHGLTTMYQTLALHDVVTISASRSTETSIVITSNHPWVPPDARNTAWRMVERCLMRLEIKAAVRIRIQKNLPIQGGMGAGSANAAAALIGLEKELGIALPGPERLRLAAEIGSDVPLFLLGGSGAWGWARRKGLSASRFAGDSLRDGAAGGRSVDAASVSGLGFIGAWQGWRVAHSSRRTRAP